MEMNRNIKAEVVAHSKNSYFDDELITVRMVMPRIILAEFNKHRMLSSSTSSSRAISFKKMVETVQNDPFIPYAWQKSHKGMQGTEYFEKEARILKLEWLYAKDRAVKYASILNKEGVTKQLCNRLLEPFMWCTVLATGNKSSWNHFFELRCPSYSISELIDGDERLFKSKKDFLKELDYDPIFPSTDLEWLQLNKGQAELHMMILAECIYDVINESTPEKLNPGEWHIPYKGQMEIPVLINLAQKNLTKYNPELSVDVHDIQKEVDILMVKIASGLAARTSYTNIGDNNKWDYNQLLRVHNKCKESGHNVVFEHCAKAMTQKEYYSFIKGEVPVIIQDDGEIVNRELYPQSYSKELGTDFYGWNRNFKGFIQYRHLLEGKL